MSKNPTDIELATACSMTIGKLKGGSGGAGGVQSIIDKIEQALVSASHAIMRHASCPMPGASCLMPE